MELVSSHNVCGVKHENDTLDKYNREWDLVHMFYSDSFIDLHDDPVQYELFTYSQFIVYNVTF